MLGFAMRTSTERRHFSSLLHRIPKELNQVKPVKHVHGMRTSVPNRLAHHDLSLLRGTLQKSTNVRFFASFAHPEHLLRVQIQRTYAVRMAFSQREVIHANTPCR